MNEVPDPNSQPSQQILMPFTVKLLMSPKPFSVKSQDEAAPKDLAGFFITAYLEAN